jgi:hypothetical protein
MSLQELLAELFMSAFHSGLPGTNPRAFFNWNGCSNNKSDFIGFTPPNYSLGLFFLNKRNLFFNVEFSFLLKNSP